MQVDYVSHMGDDLLVVNAARVSFQKHKDVMDDTDRRLIYYLANHNHWTPFGHPTICLRVKVPIFVRTQLFKHKVGFTENEVSRRYVDDEPEFFVPSEWRGRPTDGAKQGSSEAVDKQSDWEQIYAMALSWTFGTYQSMIEHGIAPEQARMVLPQSMYTEFYWTGSLAAYARVFKLRTDPHAQRETQDVVRMMGDIIEPLFPVSWDALTT